MPEKYSSPRSQFIVGRGFAAIRQATGTGIVEMAEQLELMRGRSPLVEVRHLHAKRNNPAVHMLSSREIKYLDVKQQSVPLSRIYAKLRTDVPSISRPVEVTFSDAAFTPIRNGEEFLEVKPDEESNQYLYAERLAMLTSVVTSAGGASGQPNRRDVLDMTVAFAHPGAPEGIKQTFLSVVRDFLPITLDLDSVVFHPSPDR